MPRLVAAATGGGGVSGLSDGAGARIVDPHLRVPLPSPDEQVMVTSHKTRSVFDRYHIMSRADLQGGGAEA